MNLGPYPINKEMVVAIRSGRVTVLIAKAFAYDPETAKTKATALGRAKPGDLLWMQEPSVFYENKSATWCELVFPADTGQVIPPPLTKPRHMTIKPKMRKASDMARRESRGTIDIQSVEILPAGTLTDSQVIAAGIKATIRDGIPGYTSIDNPYGCEDSATAAFRHRWIDRHGRSSWSDAMKVAVIGFRFHGDNISQFEKARP